MRQIWRESEKEKSLLPRAKENSSKRHDSHTRRTSRKNRLPLSPFLSAVECVFVYNSFGITFSIIYCQKLFESIDVWLFFIVAYFVRGAREKIRRKLFIQSFILCVLKWSKRPNAYDDNTHPKFNATTLQPFIHIECVPKWKIPLFLEFEKGEREMKQSFNFSQAFCFKSGKNAIQCCDVWLSTGLCFSFFDVTHMMPRGLVRIRKYTNVNESGCK